jgi:hypothetical protein
MVARRMHAALRGNGRPEARAMGIPVVYALPEHQRIRELLETVVISAAAAELAPYPEHAELARATAALERALLRHALFEHEQKGRLLDKIHDAEGSAAIELRHALGLKDILAQVATIGDLLGQEEELLSR